VDVGGRRGPASPPAPVCSLWARPCPPARAGFEPGYPVLVTVRLPGWLLNTGNLTLSHHTYSLFPGFEPGYPVLVTTRVTEKRSAQMFSYLRDGGFLSKVGISNPRSNFHYIYVFEPLSFYFQCLQSKRRLPVQGERSPVNGGDWGLL
jgi:hypothetical protein